MREIGDRRGVLFPERLQEFTREPAPEHLARFVRWFWIPEWTLPPGETSRQTLLPFPLCNLVVECDAPAGEVCESGLRVTVSGPTTGVSHRDLAGSGWAVGALLLPAGATALGLDPAELRDGEAPFVAPELAGAVAHAMSMGPALRRRRAATVFADWLSARLGDAPAVDAEIAGAALDAIAGDRSIVRVGQLAAVLAVSPRTLQRICRRHLGVSPLEAIRRFRLQEAAQRLRESPETTIAAIAAELGYTDHAHLTGDFRAVLGLAPRDYRAAASPTPAATARPGPNPGSTNSSSLMPPTDAAASVSSATAERDEERREIGGSG